MSGIELSQPMIDQLRQKATAEEHTGLATLDRSRTGLEHEQRVADWHGSPFTAESECHVSVWRKR